MIYLLEDDDSIRELIIYTLNGQGMDAKGFADPAVFWEAVKQEALSYEMERKTGELMEDVWSELTWEV